MRFILFIYFVYRQAVFPDNVCKSYSVEKSVIAFIIININLSSIDSEKKLHTIKDRNRYQGGM